MSSHLSGKRNPDLLSEELESLRRRVAELEQANASLEASEGRYRDLVENARDMIWTVDLAGNVTFLNSACEHITGYTKEELLGKELADLAPPNSLEAAREALSRKWKNERDTSFEIRIVAKNGSLVDLEVNSAILERNGSPAVSWRSRATSASASCFRSSCSSRTSSRRWDGWRAASLTISTICSRSSSATASFFSIASMPSIPCTPGLDQIRQSAEKAAILTRQLLAFSRKQPLEPTILDLNALVADMQKLLRRLIGEHIELVTRYSPDPCRVSADASQIEQVIMNLALNARDAMPGGGTVTIETANIELTPQNAGAYRPGHYAVLRVSDTGADIDKESRAAISSSRFSPPSATTIRGSGSPPSTAWSSSTAASFAYRARPAREPPSMFACLCSRRIPTRSRSASPESAALGGSETILVVEDEAGVRTLIAETLSVYGYSVIEANDSSEALELARRESPKWICC